MMLVLGYFGNRTNKLDGQTVKTRDVYRLAKEQYGDCVEYFDTEDQALAFAGRRMSWCGTCLKKRDNLLKKAQQ